MKPPSDLKSNRRLYPERVAYWYLRLNGFLQIENFVVHPTSLGGQRTDADLLAVRFPFRAERLIDNPKDIMRDDFRTLGLSDTKVDIVIAEVKTNQPCSLNGPWTDPAQENVHRVLAAIGCLPSAEIDQAASALYDAGEHIASSSVRVRLVAFGRDRNEELASTHNRVAQVTWVQVLDFIWNRLRLYRRQKTQVDQWDQDGRALHQLAREASSVADFTARAMAQMGVQAVTPR